MYSLQHCPNCLWCCLHKCACGGVYGNRAEKAVEGRWKRPTRQLSTMKTRNRCSAAPTDQQLMRSQMCCLTSGCWRRERSASTGLALRRRSPTRAGAGKPKAEEIAFTAFYCATTSSLKFRLKEKTTIGFSVLEAQMQR